MILLAGTVQRLSAGNLLNVALATNLTDVGYDEVTNVYVEAYDNLVNEDFAARIVGWRSCNNRNVKLCCIVIDEFKNLETETRSLISLVEFGWTFSKT